ncbi:flagellar biosynthesis protein FliQ [Nocardia sp. GAS34]|uniref:hypothetical protein n=1 Tax=unclassified Nocardia TaxID=2637762 RepID=UPI003D213E6B
MHLHPAAWWTVTALAAAVWTAAAAVGVAIGLFAAADTRCGSTVARVDMAGGWWVIGTVAIWTAPFAAGALLRRSRSMILIAGAAAVVAALVVVWMFTHPVRFCW